MARDAAKTSHKSEAPDAPLHRGWVLFCGVGDVHAPFENCRVPLGFWAYGYNAEQKDNGTHSSFSAQVCKFDNDDQIIDPQLKQFSVRSQKVIGIVSRNSAVADEYRNIDHQTRQGLGSDASFLHALRRTS